MTTLYLVRGLPGSGKSTFAKAFAGRDKAHIEADMYFEDQRGNYKFDPDQLRAAHEWCQDRVKLYLSSGVSVVVSNTSTTEKEVSPYMAIAAHYNAQFVSMIIENRHGGVNVHGVPEDKLEQMKRRFTVKL